VQHFFFHTIIGETIISYLLMFIVPLLLPALFIKLVGFQGLKQLFSYEPKQSIIHRLDPRLKIIYPILIGILAVVLNWQFVFILFALTLIPWILLNPSKDRIQVLITMAGVPALGMIWSQGMFHAATHADAYYLFQFPWTVSWYGTHGVSTEGILYGAEQAGRMLVAVSASLILLLTTTPSEIIWAFYKFRMPAAAGLAFTVAIRFLPQMIEKLTLLLKAIEVRGYDLTIPRWYQIYRYPSYIKKIFFAIPIVTVPLLIGSLRSTSVMAMVADARAFGAMPKRTILKEHQTTMADKIALGTLITVTMAVFLLVSLHIGNRTYQGGY
jgi:energy-coupling factor transport system permease protein